MFKLIPFISVLLCLVVTWVHPSPSIAKGPSLIRDAEIENTIRAYATPLFLAADLDPQAIKVHLINDNSLNAFVANGLNMFINTGLLMKSSSPSEVIGVIAHETGHILGGHLVQRSQAVKDAASYNILGYVLGGLAVAGGRSDVGAAVIKGSQAAGITAFLNYNRSQESAADQSAVRLLEATKQTAKGLKTFMEILADQELLSSQYQSPYIRTHPISRHRIDFFEEHLRKSKYADAPDNPKFIELNLRMQAKLKAFIEPPKRTLRTYKESDKTIVARYARAIAYYKSTNLEKALPLIESLIKEEPQNPYFRELKGQMLFENGRVVEALAPYQTAAKYAPKSALILVDLARVKLELDEPDYLQSAMKNLQNALRYEPHSSFAWRQLAIAAGRSGLQGITSLAMTEEAFLQGRKNDARYHASQADKYLKRGSREWLRVQDIKAQLGLKKNGK
ncbi:MAG: M48 family metalloprotease [Rhodospirillales bacterium]|nr:M48 family metalloprotease [Rhodospirillales bacterium]